MVGDGGFLMTGNELSTAAKLGHDPIVIVLNNSSYATLRYIDKPRPYYELPDQDYAQMARAMGGDGMRVGTRRDFRNALRRAEGSKRPFLIDAIIRVEDCSHALRRLGELIGKVWKKH
jgi:indolepyruvate decarboxylase